MPTNDTNKKLIYPELSYLLTGILFSVHNKLGRYAREKQYSDTIEGHLEEQGVPYLREFRFGDTGNVVDFLVDQKIILEVKAKPLITKDDFYQVQRYLQSLNKNLGLIANFRNRYLKPIRIVKIDTDTKKKFLDS